MSEAEDVTWGDVVVVAPGGQYKFPDSPGVYAFAEVGNDGDEVRYVGRSSNLKERIDDHFRGSDNSCLEKMLENTASVKIRATVERIKERRMDIEHTCYVHYSKQGHKLCNDVEPKGSLLEGMEMPF